MDQSEHSIPHDLYARLAANSLTEGADVCCVRTAIDAERFFLLAIHSPDAIEKDLRSAAVIRLLPLAGTVCKP
jgi:hypothetical protein